MSRLACWMTLATCLAASIGLLMASPASACYYANGGHCWAQAEWANLSIKETLIDAHTSLASVPKTSGYKAPNGLYFGPREQDETWSIFSDPYNSNLIGWIEVGDTAGQITPSEFVQSPAYFEASQSWSYPEWQKENFTYVNIPGPGPGTAWWDATTYTQNLGSWCATLQGTDLFCFPGLAQYANILQDGLEFAANNNPEADGGAYAENEGQVIGYAVNSSGQVSQWNGAHLQYKDGQPGDPWPPAGAWGVCGKLNALGQGNGAITVEAPAWLDWSECSPGPIEWLSAAAGPAGAIEASNQTPEQLLNDFGAPPPTAPAPLEAYLPPSSPTLTTSSVLSRASQIATEEGDEPSPTSVRAVMNVPLDSALGVAAPGATTPQSPSATMSAWLHSGSDVITMHGHFTLVTTPHPSQAANPSGAQLTLILDAHTGQLDAMHLGGAEPEIAKLGAVSVLR
jgi:hypothetical protein